LAGPASAGPRDVIDDEFKLLEGQFSSNGQKR